MVGLTSKEIPISIEIKISAEQGLSAELELIRTGVPTLRGPENVPQEVDQLSGGG